MHRHRILAQFSLILSILNLVFAAPIIGRKRHDSEAPRDEMVLAEDLAAILKKRHVLEAASDRSTSPRSPAVETEDPQLSSLSGWWISSGYHSPVHMTDSWYSDYSSFVPLRLNQNPPTQGISQLETTAETPKSGGNPVSLQDSASPHPSNSVPGLSEIQQPEGPQELQAERPPSSFLPAGLASPLASYRHSSSKSLEILDMRIPDWFRKFELVPGRVETPQRTGSDEATTETDPLVEVTPEELAPSHHLTADGPPLSHSSPPIETPPDNVNFLKKDARRIAIPVAVASLALVVTARILGIGLKPHNQPES